MQSINIGICGLGTVGGGTVNVLLRNKLDISARVSCPINIVQIGARRENPNVDTSGIDVTADIFEVARNPNVQIVVELIGGTTVARDLVLEAIEHGKHVVTANKALIAEHGNEILAKAEAKGVAVLFEAAVAGGIPIVRSLKEGLSANRIEWLVGIINGTGNFILTEMRLKSRDFDDVLAEAQRLGYAEADPTFDVEGIDACHKLVILASIAFGIPLDYSKAYTEGIADLQPEDVSYAERLGYRIKHLGIARKTNKGVELRVHPTLIPAGRLIANVNGVMNAVLVKGDAVGPTLYYGAGAGAEPTASAVVSDVIELARDLCLGNNPLAVPALSYSSKEISAQSILPIEEIRSAYYLRFVAEDRPGVMSEVSRLFADSGISIEALQQNEPAENQLQVEVVMISNVVEEKVMNQVIKSLEALDSVSGKVSRIRVESLAG